MFKHYYRITRNKCETNLNEQATVLNELFNAHTAHIKLT